MEQYILRLPEVKARSSFSRSTLYQHIADGLWTKPVKLGTRSVGWPKHEVEQLVAALISGQNREEIKKLVNNLQALRQNVGTSLM